jgi:hypothetical protein
VAENIRADGPHKFNLSPQHAALVAECRDEEGSCLYTSTSFFIWLRWLKALRAALWGGGAIGSVVAASHILEGGSEHKFVAAGAALVGVLLPGLIKAVRLDSAIRGYTKAAAKFKILQGELRRLACIWSEKELVQFEQLARHTFSQLNDARKASLTPPEICFWLARRKIRKGHYTPDRPERAAE